MKENWENHWKDYYQILQVHPSAEPEVIKAAHDKLALKYHPDINKDPTANQRMMDINEAYEILSNIDKKNRYHSAYLQRMSKGSSGDFNSTFMSSKPKPEVYPSIIRFQGLAPGETKKDTFIIKNSGGPYSKIWLSNSDLWIRVVSQKPLSDTGKLPLFVEIEVKGEDWGKTYVDNVIIKLDDVETHVRIELQTCPQPAQAPSYGSPPTNRPSPINNSGNKSKRNKGLLAIAGTFGIIVVILGVLFLKSNSTKSPLTSTSQTTSQTQTSLTPSTPSVNSSTTKPTTAVPKPVGNQIVNFPDPNLLAAIRQAINKPTGNIYTSDLQNLTQLVASNGNISNLTGLEYCTNLTICQLLYQKISDISPIASLHNLTNLWLSGNQINNVTPIASLTKLTELYLDGNKITNLTALNSLHNLTHLDLDDTMIKDITPLKSLTKLTEIFLSNNQISDISTLASLTNLTTLILGSNPFTNPNGNQITDVSPLASLTNLTYLVLSGNQISNISPLASLTKLTRLNLYNDRISDISPLVPLTKLTEAYLNNNPLSATSLNTYIPQLKSRGVKVYYP